MIDFRVKSGRAGVVCKLDIEIFLMYVLKRTGFGERWITWIRYCIYSTSFAVLVNGSPMDFFLMSRGLRACGRETLYPPFCFCWLWRFSPGWLEAASSAGLIFGFQVRIWHQQRSLIFFLRMTSLSFVIMIVSK